jgi:hypothetical protein
MWLETGAQGTRNVFGILKGNLLKTISFNDQEGDRRIILREADGNDSGSGPMAEFDIISLSFYFCVQHS